MSEQIPSKLALLQELLELQQQIPPLMLTANTQMSQGNLEAAIATNEKVIALSKTKLERSLMHNQYHPDPIDIPPIVGPLVNTLLMQADFVESLGDQPKAEALRVEGMALSKQYLSEADAAERERQRAGSLTAQGRFNEALVSLSAARDLFQLKQENVKAASVTVDLAGALEWLGDFDRARMEAESAEKVIAPLLAATKPAQGGGKLAGIFQGNASEMFNAFTAATDFLASLRPGQGLDENAFSVVSAANDRLELLRIAAEIDQIQARSSRYLAEELPAGIDRERLLAKAAEIFTRILVGMPGEDGKHAIEWQLAAIQVQRGQYQAGLDYVARLEPAFRRRGLLRPKLAALYKLQAQALLALGHPQQALEKLEWAIRDIQTYHDLDLLWRLEWMRGRTLVNLNKLPPALGAYERAIQLINDLRKAPRGYRLDSTYLLDKLPVYVEAIDLTAKMGNAEACCRVIEMIKSRILTTTLSLSHEMVAQPSAFDQRADELNRQIDAIGYTIDTTGPTKELEAKRATLIKERTALLERLRFSDPRWRALTEPVAFDLGGVVQSLNSRKQAALNLFYQDTHIVSVLIKDGRCRVGSLELSGPTKERLKTYQEHLESDKLPDQLDALSWSEQLNADDLIPSELLVEALNASSLLIVPHSNLHLIPWAGLSYRDRHLFEYCPVGLVPNLSWLLQSKSGFAPAPKIALIGPPDYTLYSIGQLELTPLFEAEKEIPAIHSIYLRRGGAVVAPQIGKDATEAAFWNVVDHYGMNGLSFTLPVMVPFQVMSQ